MVLMMTRYDHRDSLELTVVVPPLEAISGSGNSIREDEVDKRSGTMVWRMESVKLMMRL